MCDSDNFEKNLMIGLFKELHKKQLITKYQLEKCINQIVETKEEKHR